MSDLRQAKNPHAIPGLYRRAFIDALWKFNPLTLMHNPVIFTVEIGAVITLLLFIQDLFGKAISFSMAMNVGGEETAGFVGAISAWLWFTVLFANFAEALAEGRGKAQAEALRKMRRDTIAKKLDNQYAIQKGKSPGPEDYQNVSSSILRKGDLFYVQTNDMIPVDGEIVEGIASVNESAITGESAPVIRESGGDRSAVTGGTSILSDWLIVRVSANPGEGFLDHMISLVEGAKRQKTPNEIALFVLLIGLTAAFAVVSATLWAFSWYSVNYATGTGTVVSVTVPYLILCRPCTDDHRGAPFSDWHCRHGPAHPAERDHDIRAGDRGGWRRRCSPARQDRDHHAREPSGSGTDPGRWDRYHGSCRDGTARIAR